ncbi:MAG TPA: hypothetical protein VL860_01680, partial [Planctomycetota bacterium]|nr:hypothetical protein [Planctomycetota bacterium]
MVRLFRTSTRPRLAVLWVTLMLSVAAPRPLPATTLAYMTTLDLLKASETVVVGKVESTRYEERNGQIVTVITVRIEETWKGQTTSKTVEIVEPGGIMGDRGSGSGGMPQFQTGDRIVAFLEKDKSDLQGRLTTTGGVAGRHLVIDVPAPAQQGGGANQPGAGGKALLARPISDANCDLAGHDATGRTVLLEYDAMMRIEGRHATTLDQFRTEVTGYQKALDAGATPPLSERDSALAKAFQDALDHDPKHTRTGAGQTAGDLPKPVPGGST